MIKLHNSYKLVTKEDPMHIHKTLGIICMANFGYRYYLLFTTGSMDLHNNTAAILMLAHSALSLTSLVYHIPLLRNKISPMIYPEYRLHSILFAVRSVVCYFLIYWRYSMVYNFAACYATMIMADAVTARYQNPELTNKRTMGDMPFDKRIGEEERQEIVIMQSTQQIGATLFMTGNLDSCFSPMFAIQFAAFLMTLVRKSIIDTNMWHLGYNCALWINAFCYISLPIGYVIVNPILFNAFYCWRFSVDRNSYQFVGNKYVGWAGVFTLLYVYNRTLNEKISGFILQNNMEMAIRNGLIIGYLVTQMYKSKGLLVAFRAKT